MGLKQAAHSTSWVMVILINFYFIKVFLLWAAFMTQALMLFNGWYMNSLINFWSPLLFLVTLRQCGLFRVTLQQCGQLYLYNY